MVCFHLFIISAYLLHKENVGFTLTHNAELNRARNAHRATKLRCFSDLLSRF